MPYRRQVLQRLVAGTALALFRVPPVFADAASVFASAMDALERRHGGRLGAAVFDAASGRRVAHRGDERFLLCSTVKLPAAAMILSRVDAGQESLDRHIDYTVDDLVTYSPETSRHVGTGMTLGAICRAGLTLSDNTAGNLMLASVGGPRALTAFLRSLGDEVTRSDRYEVALNDYAPGDTRDTTAPSAMLQLMQRVLLGDVLSSASKHQLVAWMRANRTGDRRLRAGLAPAWRVGDKTGSGGNNTANDIAIAWPQANAPVLVSAYYTASTASHAERDRVLADVGRAVTRFMRRTASI